ncbi:MAG: class I SAM-dependent methyltransferase [Betaproteobacteria bacterium]|nr:class I SAM-dependent methyltransferase [Betaproteobacteria bacterium]
MISQRTARLLLAIVALAATASRAQDDGTTPYVQSPMDVVERMLWLAHPGPSDFIVDLGSGDGRIVIEAAKRYGARGLGVDLDPRLVRLSEENARKAGVADRARFQVGDFFELDFRDATIVSAYLLPEVNLKLRPKLLAMPPGTRIVTHDYDMGDWPYDEMVELPVAEKLVGPLGRSKAFLFIVPANVRGSWRSELPQHGGRWQFEVEQAYQQLRVKARAGVNEQVVRGVRLRGEELRLVMSGVVAGKPWTEAFRGRVRDERIEGEVAVTNGDETRTLPWTATRIR